LIEKEKRPIFRKKPMRPVPQELFNQASDCISQIPAWQYNAFVVVSCLIFFFMIMCVFVPVKGRGKNLIFLFSIILLALALVDCGIILSMSYVSC
jgi:hypothetical protein